MVGGWVRFKGSKTRSQTRDFRLFSDFWWHWRCWFSEPDGPEVSLACSDGDPVPSVCILSLQEQNMLANGLCWLMGRPGWTQHPQSWRSHFGKTLLCHSQERQARKSIHPLRTLHSTGASLSAAICQTQSLEWDETRWQGRCRSTLIALLGS